MDKTKDIIRTIPKLFKRLISRFLTTIIIIINDNSNENIILACKLHASHCMNLCSARGAIREIAFRKAYYSFKWGCFIS